MFDREKRAMIEPLTTLSLDKLAEFAIEEELIDRFEVGGNDVTIVQGDLQFRLPHRQASTFLIGMLRGRSWYVDDSSRGDAADPEKVAKPGDASASVEETEPAAGRTIEATLEALLTFTKDTGIIKGYRKEPRDRIVQIDIPACSSVFSYVDAVSYLFDCVQHEVRITTERAKPGTGPS